MANETGDRNKRIAKNTLYLYLRMFLMMAIGPAKLLRAVSGIVLFLTS